MLLGAPAVALRAAVPLALWLSLMPLTAYARTIERAQRAEHPLQDLRACLAPVAQRLVAQGQPAPGVWVEAIGFSHRYTYYLYGLGPWQQRDIASNGTVAMHLFAPNAYRPVMLSAERYANFQQQLGQNTNVVLAQAAAHAELSPDILADGFRRNEVSVVTWEDVRLLLPGPFAPCASERLPVGSR